MMSQGLFNSLFIGPKEPQAARKVIKFVTYFGFVALGIALAVIFMPYEPLQKVLSEAMPSKWPFVAASLISIICLVFLYKEHFWAPCTLVALKLVDIVLAYMETGDFPGGIDCFTLVFYLSAAQAVYFLKKQKSESIVNNSESGTPQ